MARFSGFRCLHILLSHARISAKSQNNRAHCTVKMKHDGDRTGGLVRSNTDTTSCTSGRTLQKMLYDDQPTALK